MKHQTNDLLRSALKRVNSVAKALGLSRQFDITRIRSDWSPEKNYEAFKRFFNIGRFELCNDVNSGAHSTGIITRVGDAAIAQYLLVQKASSLVSTNVAVFTSGNPFGVTLQGGVSATEPSPVRLLCGGVGTVLMTSDSSAAVAVGDILVGVSGGSVKTNTATGAEALIVGIAIEPCGNGATGTDKEFEVMPTYNNKSV